jgi:GrpB-like predicted nucleotidyltransferase (UPF0157 family)/RimJ/RimL family protein N-acetyltransferase
MPVLVEQYNEEWPQHFVRIKSDIEKCLQGVSYTSIEHVGSTSVPGLAARPVIDIDITVTYQNMQTALHALFTNGHFDYARDAGIMGFIIRGRKQPRSSITICLDGCGLTRFHVKLRNMLRSDIKLREEYAYTKLAAAANHCGYEEAKGAFLAQIFASGILTSGEFSTLAALNTNPETWVTLKTKRLLLREFAVKDVQGYYELESSEENAKYQDWPPRTLDQARELVIANIASKNIRPRKTWELVVESEGRMIGRVGAALKRIDGDGPANVVQHFDIWFSFLPIVQGRGFATEATDALINDLLESRSGEPVELEIECDPRNIGSSRLAERLGFEKHSLTEKAWESKGQWVDSLVYRKIV